MGAATGDNVIDLTGGSVTSNVFGNAGYGATGSNTITFGSGTATGNNVFNVTSGTILGNITGNDTSGGDAQGATTINLSGSTVGGGVAANIGGNVNAGSKADIIVGQNEAIGGGVGGNIALNGNITDSDSQTTVDGLITGNIAGNSANGSIYNSTSAITIGQHAVVGGSVYGNSAGGTTDATSNIIVNGEVMGNVIAGDGTDTASVGVMGNVFGTISGSSSLIPEQPDGNVNVLTLNFGSTSNQAEFDTVTDYVDTHPSDGTVFINGKTYTWVNWSQVLFDLGFEPINQIIVTWFNPADNRLDGKAADRIALYCHADKDTLGVLLVNGDSAGNVGTSFKVSKLETLGPHGTSVSFGANGVLSIMMSPDGSGYAAWNGGVDGVNGLGDFAKTFTCK